MFVCTLSRDVWPSHRKPLRILRMVVNFRTMHEEFAASSTMGREGIESNEKRVARIALWTNQGSTLPSLTDSSDTIRSFFF